MRPSMSRDCCCAWCCATCGGCSAAARESPVGRGVPNAGDALNLPACARCPCPPPRHSSRSAGGRATGHGTLSGARLRASAAAAAAAARSSSARAEARRSSCVSLARRASSTATSVEAPAARGGSACTVAAAWCMEAGRHSSAGGSLASVRSSCGGKSARHRCSGKPRQALKLGLKQIYAIYAPGAIGVSARAGEPEPSSGRWRQRSVIRVLFESICAPPPAE